MELTPTASRQICTKNAKIWGLEINDPIDPVLRHTTTEDLSPPS